MYWYFGGKKLSCEWHHTVLWGQSKRALGSMLYGRHDFCSSKTQTLLIDTMFKIQLPVSTCISRLMKSKSTKFYITCNSVKNVPCNVKMLCSKVKVQCLGKDERYIKSVCCARTEDTKMEARTYCRQEQRKVTLCKCTYILWLISGRTQREYVAASQFYHLKILCIEVLDFNWGKISRLKFCLTVDLQGQIWWQLRTTVHDGKSWRRHHKTEKAPRHCA